MGCITKRNDRYVVDTYDQYGKRYRKTLPKGTLKKDAQDILREIESKISRRTFMHEKKTPLFSEVAQKWLEWKKSDVRVTTWNGFENVVKKRFGLFDSLKISQITVADVERWFTVMRESGLKHGSIKDMTVTLGQILNYAVRHKLIDANPIREAKRPRKKMEDDTKPQVLTPEQIRALLESVKNPKMHAFLMISIFTGARKGEVLGLKWTDIDFDKRKIQISRTFNHGQLFMPKTKSSIRGIDCPPVLMTELRQWMVKSGSREGDFVFPAAGDTNIPMNGVTIHHHFVASLKAAGCPRVRLHDLRHTYASLLLSQGENIKYIQTQLGHSTPMMTLNVYSHLMKDENQEAAQKLQKAILG